jgi:glyoxylase-like metal-dependent hydrolase (beta-lactamase superfamily II)
MYTIKALHNNYISFPVSGSAMYFQEKLDQQVEVFGYLWLIKGNGKIICVDSGLGLPPNDTSDNKSQVLGNFTIDYGKDTISLLNQEGLASEDVDYLILTHLHFDHCANVRLFPRAEILISHRGWGKVMAPDHPGMVPAGLFPRSVFAYLVQEAWDRVKLLPEEIEILPGLSVFWIGGHTPCSQAIKIATEKGTAIITGDTVFYFGNIEENIPVAYCTNLAECYLAMDRIRREATIILPNHDPLVLKRYPGGVIT